MRVPIDWLHEYCAPELSAHELAERLALTGTEVERVERHGVGSTEHFVVGRVLERRKHPDADRLSVCMVDTGGSASARIVCGAPNVQAGQTVAVARPGAVMPTGVTLQKANLRGQNSEGMILAEDEVAIGTDHDGIMVLEDGIPPGTPLASVLPIQTDVLVLEITPNRPDCLGIYGVAREVHAATGAPLAAPPWERDQGSEGDLDGVEILVEAGEELCPRFTARVLEHVRIGPSPWWMKARLMAAGQRPISNVVDITNYVMLLTGQPLHAFDLERVAGSRLTIRRGRAGERVQTLDGQERELDDHAVVIDDAEGPTSIGGIMGGARSEVHEDTQTVLMEAATWNGPNIHRTSLKLGLRSEASARFEKQLQPEQAMWAQVVSTELMVDLCGARVRAGTIDIGGPGPAPSPIALRQQRMGSLLGMEIPRERAAELLGALGFQVGWAPDGLEVAPPAFRRADVTREADLIEEVARLYGLEQLPATLPSRRAAFGALTSAQRRARRAADVLVSQGLDEIVGWSFTGPQSHARLGEGPASEAGSASDRGGSSVVTLANPISRDLSQLRTTLLVSLLEVAQRNLARGAVGVRMFEMGAVYLRYADDELPREPQRVGALLAGPARAATWREPDPPYCDFFAAKGVLVGLLDAFGASWELRPFGGDVPVRQFLHPGRAAEVLVAGRPSGWLGELHPSLAAERDLPGAVSAFELDLDSIPIPPAVLYEDVTSFPAVREDLAVIVPDEVPSARVIEAIRVAGAPLLASADVFDVYRDEEKLGAGHVSLAVRMSFRARDRTLTDEEVARQRRKIASALEDELGGRVRDR